MDNNEKILKIKSVPLRRMDTVAERELSSINLIVLHHSACEHKTVKEINEMHIARGFSCIGYHFYIRKDGTIYRGRQLEEIGAHCKGYNAHSIGICLEGNFVHSKPTYNQLKSLKRLLCDLYHILIADVDVRLHRDFSPTLCPARDLIRDLILFNEEDNKEVHQ